MSYCRALYTCLDIGPDGHAHPCCRAYAIDFGHISENPWQSPILQDLREQMATDTLDPVRFADCMKCPLKENRP